MALFYSLILMAVLALLVLSGAMRQRQLSAAEVSVYEQALQQAQAVLQFCVQDVREGATLRVVTRPVSTVPPNAWRTQWDQAQAVVTASGQRGRCMVEAWPLALTQAHSSYQVTAMAETGATEAWVQTQFVVDRSGPLPMIKRSSWRELLRPR